MSFDDISVISNRRHISLLTEDILYIQLSGRQSIIHFSEIGRASCRERV